MSKPVTVAMPIADRRVSYAFYGAGLGFSLPGELEEDGVPEPLQVRLGEQLHVALIPTGGFGWVVGGRTVAAPGQHECIITLSLATQAGVDELIAKARAAGADIVTEPEQQAWGYAAAFADPDGHIWQIMVDEAS
ncbi:hypothetical protein EV191_101695 [Tamaricihabitans halophyticus]|uniref:VOC domain-containing protein n=1 Tax=Tamaricihabitans halophyticus TaxID=1262583 RepID=A0A4R2R4P6_9PSEU|nr:VOC family protein [Tamaricihabitans halophyticus]TCP56749.1 hypothetical protein EV191_101695 [Tamaricihabitans halophyticus]